MTMVVPLPPHPPAPVLVLPPAALIRGVAVEGAAEGVTDPVDGQAVDPVDMSRRFMFNRAVSPMLGTTWGKVGTTPMAGMELV